MILWAHTIIVIGFETYLLYLLLDGFFEVKSHKRWFLFLIIILLQLIKQLYFVGPAAIILSYFIDFSCFYLYFKSRWQKLVLLCTLFYALLTLADLFFGAIFSYLETVRPAGFKVDNVISYFYIASVLSRTSILLLICFIRRRFAIKYDYVPWQVFWILPNAVVAFSLYYFPLQSDSNPVIAQITLGACALMFLLIISLLIVAQNINKAQRQKSEIALLKAQQDSFKMMMREEEKDKHEINVLRHDLMSLVQTAEIMLTEENIRTDEVQSYVEKLKQRWPSGAYRYTGNPFMDAAIRVKHEVMKSANLPFVFEHRGLSLEPLAWVDSVDLCIILVNGLANAIEAATKLEDPRPITLTIEYIGRRLTITIENDYQEEPVKRGGTLKSNKEGSGHGIGLNIIKAAAEKCNGFTNIHYRDGHFILEVILQNKSGLAIDYIKAGEYNA